MSDEEILARLLALITRERGHQLWHSECPALDWQIDSLVYELTTTKLTPPRVVPSNERE